MPTTSTTTTPAPCILPDELKVLLNTKYFANLYNKDDSFVFPIEIVLTRQEDDINGMPVYAVDAEATLYFWDHNYLFNYDSFASWQEQLYKAVISVELSYSGSGWFLSWIYSVSGETMAKTLIHDFVVVDDIMPCPFGRYKSYPLQEDEEALVAIEFDELPQYVYIECDNDIPKGGIKLAHNEELYASVGATENDDDIRYTIKGLYQGLPFIQHFSTYIPEIPNPSIKFNQTFHENAIIYNAFHNRCTGKKMIVKWTFNLTDTFTSETFLSENDEAYFPANKPEYNWFNVYEKTYPEEFVYEINQDNNCCGRMTNYLRNMLYSGASEFSEVTPGSKPYYDPGVITNPTFYETNTHRGSSVSIYSMIDKEAQKGQKFKRPYFTYDIIFFIENHESVEMADTLKKLHRLAWFPSNTNILNYNSDSLSKNYAFDLHRGVIPDSENIQPLDVNFDLGDNTSNAEKAQIYRYGSFLGNTYGSIPTNPNLSEGDQINMAIDLLKDTFNRRFRYGIINAPYNEQDVGNMEFCSELGKVYRVLSTTKPIPSFNYSRNTYLAIPCLYLLLANTKESDMILPLPFVVKDPQANCVNYFIKWYLHKGRFSSESKRNQLIERIYEINLNLGFSDLSIFEEFSNVIPAE